jgi:5-methylcytosine-specific restriction endonuclease McrA
MSGCIRRIFGALVWAAVAVHSFSTRQQNQHFWFQAPSSSAKSGIPTTTTLQSARTFTRRKTKSQRVVTSKKERNSPSSSSTIDRIDPSFSDYLQEYSLSNQLKPTSSSEPFERYPCLVLNADYQPISYMPLSVWHWQDAIKSVFLGKVTVVDVYPDKAVRAARCEFPLPSVIAVTEYVQSQQRTTPAFTRHNVLLRDEYRCQYCHNRFSPQDLSLDHVVPRSHGGTLTWTNAVACCRHCNGRKGCKSVAEIQELMGMTLLRKPVAPTQYELTKIASRLMLPRKIHPTWKPYLYRSE